MKLYVRRVFITDEADLLPSYLRFVRGVVDSEDVPLNISREMLQSNPVVGQIRKALTSRVLSELEGLAGRDAGAYDSVWDAFGAVLKEGLYEDRERRETLLRLARFRSTVPGWRSLKDYVGALRPNQTEIYYLVGDSLERLKASPQLEAARARGIEVLLLNDPIDHFWTATGPSFDGKPLKSLTHGDVDLSLVPPQDGGEDQPKGAGGQRLGEQAEIGALRLGERRARVASPGDERGLPRRRGAVHRGLDRILARQELERAASRCSRSTSSTRSRPSRSGSPGPRPRGRAGSRRSRHASARRGPYPRGRGAGRPAALRRAHEPAAGRGAQGGSRERAPVGSLKEQRDASDR